MLMERCSAVQIDTIGAGDNAACLQELSDNVRSVPDAERLGRQLSTCTGACLHTRRTCSYAAFCRLRLDMHANVGQVLFVF